MLEESQRISPVGNIGDGAARKSVHSVSEPREWAGIAVQGTGAGNLLGHIWGKPRQFVGWTVRYTKGIVAEV